MYMYVSHATPKSILLCKHFVPNHDSMEFKSIYTSSGSLFSPFLEKESCGYEVNSPHVLVQWLVGIM